MKFFYFFYSEFWTVPYSTQERKLQVFNLGYFRRILGNTVRKNGVLSRAGIPSMFTLTSTSTPSTLAGLCSQDGRWTHPQKIYSTASLPLLGQGSVAAPGYALTKNYPNHDFRLILLRRSYLYEKSPF